MNAKAAFAFFFRVTGLAIVFFTNITYAVGSSLTGVAAETAIIIVVL